jgi:hypothetical protein
VTRHARKTDRNHAEIRDGLRALGYEVLDLSAAGCGVPDLAVRIAPGKSHMLEVKDGDKPLSKQALTPAQEQWHYFNWQTTTKCTSLQQAVEAIEWARNRA